MAPIRRYLRITKYSVLECRIYLDNPALAQSWLLHPGKPVLPRVMESVRPLVLPKLREEKERAKKKGAKKGGIKDVVVEDDFEVSIFLTETSTRHSLLYKHKHMRGKTQTKLASNSSRLTGASRDAPMDVDGRDLGIGLGEDAGVPGLRHEDTDDELDGVMVLDDIPAIGEATASGRGPWQAKRRRETRLPDEGEADDDDFQDVERDSPGGDEAEAEEPPQKRPRDGANNTDDKKKLAMDISYEGFAIYGRVLCLVVKRRDGRGRTSTTGNQSQMGGAPMMESWIASTQMPAAAADDADAS